MSRSWNQTLPFWVNTWMTKVLSIIYKVFKINIKINNFLRCLSFWHVKGTYKISHQIPPSLALIAGHFLAHGHDCPDPLAALSHSSLVRPSKYVTKGVQQVEQLVHACAEILPARLQARKEQLWVMQRIVLAEEHLWNCQVGLFPRSLIA